MAGTWHSCAGPLTPERPNSGMTRPASRSLCWWASRELEVADPLPQAPQGIVGVDVGQRSVAVATDTPNKTTFFPGQEVRAQADHSARTRDCGSACSSQALALRHDAWSVWRAERDR